MKLEINIEDNISIMDDGEQIISIEMDYDMNDILKELEELIRYINKRI